MAIYQKSYYSATFKLKDSAGAAINITGWTFRADFRVHTSDADPVLLSLTSANGGFTIIDGAAGRVQMSITASQANSLPLGKVMFDVFRTDVSPGPVRKFGCSVKVKQPVTRI